MADLSIAQQIFRFLRYQSQEKGRIQSTGGNTSGLEYRADNN